MTPAARTAALIELLSELERDGRTGPPADRLLQRYVRARRYIGGGDRRAISEDYFNILRDRERLKCLAAAAGAAPVGPRQILTTYLKINGADLEDLFTSGRYAADGLSDAEKDWLARIDPAAAVPERAAVNCPEWAEPGLRRRFGEAFVQETGALTGRAPVCIRANRLKTSVEDLREALRETGIQAERGRLGPDALIVTEGEGKLRATKAAKTGLFAYQDEGSQIAAALLVARPGLQIADYCAGTGGKTLALAAAMAGRGQIYAMDVVPARLARLQKRAQAAGARNVQVLQLKAGDEESRTGGRLRALAGQLDAVLVDAPCSGTGSWRRQPELRFRMNDASLGALIRNQDEILEKAAVLVRPGGRLLFVTCSLLPEEGEDRIAAFLSRNPDWTNGPLAERWQTALRDGDGRNEFINESAVVLTPLRHGCDGFFIAELTRR